MEYKYIIGSSDDFESSEHLCGYALVHDVFAKNLSVFSIQIPEGIEVPGYTGDQLALAIMQGDAFEAGWCNDGIYSCFIFPDGRVVHLP
jgi:hypothetical protein